LASARRRFFPILKIGVQISPINQLIGSRQNKKKNARLGQFFASETLRTLVDSLL